MFHLCLDTRQHNVKSMLTEEGRRTTLILTNIELLTVMNESGSKLQRCMKASTAVES